MRYEITDSSGFLKRSLFPCFLRIIFPEKDDCHFSYLHKNTVFPLILFGNVGLNEELNWIFFVFRHSLNFHLFLYNIINLTISATGQEPNF